MIYDIVIAGGGTAGCAAAYIAGKKGLKVLLLEKNICLGGTMTSGLVIPIMQSGKNQINTEFYNDLIGKMHNMKGQITYQNNPGWFNPELLKIALDELLTEVNLDIRFQCGIYDIIKKNGSIKELYINRKILSEYSYPIDINNKTLFEPIATKYVIDATGDCEIFKKLNCKLQTKNNLQPSNLRFIMSGIDLDKFSKWLLELDSDRNVTTCELIDGDIHLSTAYTWDNKKWALKPLFDEAVAKGDLKDTDRNYFQIFTIARANGSIAFNCPRLLDYDATASIENHSIVLIEARRAIFRISNFCIKYFPGFEKAYISNIANILGVRESDNIIGKYIYTIDDIKNGSKFDNPAVISDYPIDVHSVKKDTSTLEFNKEYQLPIEALMSAQFDNLFAVGKILSADCLAQGALRVQASCFSMGEAVAKFIYNKLQI